MKIVRYPTISWEPAIIELVAEKKHRLSEAQILNCVEAWLVARDDSKICSCNTKHVHVAQRDKRTVRLAIQWICELCLPSLATRLGRDIPTVSQLNFGRPPLPARPGPPKFVAVRERRVRFETGEQVIVPPFLIGQRAVSIGEFQNFVDATGYVTHAERQGELENFRNHFAVQGFVGAERAALPATYLCFEDASRYCDWAGVRLPSEAEFLAACVLDDTVYPAFSDEMRQRLQGMQKKGEALLIATFNFTSTKATDDRIVVRRGPKYFMIKGWESQVSINRQVLDSTDFSVSVEFRVIKH